MCSFSDLSFSCSRGVVSRISTVFRCRCWALRPCMTAGREARGSAVNTESFYCLSKVHHHIVCKKCISIGCPPCKLKFQCCFQKDKQNTHKTDKPQIEVDGVGFLLQLRQTSAGEPSTAAWRTQGQQPQASAWRVAQN